MKFESEMDVKVQNVQPLKIMGVLDTTVTEIEDNPNTTSFCDDYIVFVITSSIIKVCFVSSVFIFV